MKPPIATKPQPRPQRATRFTRSRFQAWASPRHVFVAGVLVLLVATLCPLLFAGRAGAAPTPTPSPSPTFYEPGLEPTVPGLLPPQSSGSAAPRATSTGKGAAGNAAKEQSDQKRAAADRKAKMSAAWQKSIAKYKADSRNGGVLSAFEVTDEYGTPVSAYRIFSDDGGWTDWDLKIESFMVDMFFLGTKWFVSFGCFLIAWSLSFKLAGLLLKPALVVSDALYTNMLVQIGLPGLCLVYAGVVAGWHLMFGRKARGWGEAAAALVISALSVTALVAPPQMLLSEQHGAVASARGLALEVAALVLDNEDLHATKPSTVSSAEKGTAGWESPDATQLSRPITNALVDAFIVRPSMLLSYGQTFEGKCAKDFQKSRIEQAVADDWVDGALDSGPNMFRKYIPWVGNTIGDIVKGATAGTNQIIKEKIQATGPMASFEKACVKGGNTKALKKASMDKVGGALFMMIAALLVCIFITVLDGGFLYAQFCIAKEAMIAKVALVIGVLPGGGRSFLTARVISILRYLWLMVLSVGALAILIVLITAIVNATSQEIPGGVTIRFVVIDIACVSAFIYRKQLAHSTHDFSMRAQAKIGKSVFGGGSPSPTSRAPKKSMGKMLNDGKSHVRRVRKVIGRTATIAGGPTKALVAGGMKLGKVGLKSTVGLPVYGPRAARRTRTAVASVPERVTSTAASLQQRLTEVNEKYSPPVKDFWDESKHNARSVGRLLRGRRPLGAYNPPQRSTPPRPAGASAARRRPVPAHVQQPPASPAQAALKLRLHRSRSREATPPVAPAPTTLPGRPARRLPRRGGRL